MNEIFAVKIRFQYLFVQWNFCLFLLEKQVSNEHLSALDSDRNKPTLEKRRPGSQNFEIRKGKRIKLDYDSCNKTVINFGSHFNRFFFFFFSDGTMASFSGFLPFVEKKEKPFSANFPDEINDRFCSVRGSDLSPSY